VTRSTLVLLCAYLCDCLIGDPKFLPHPVRFMGYAVTSGEPYARRFFPQDPKGERLAGAALTLVVCGGSALVSDGILRFMCQFDRRITFGIEMFISASTLATRDLLFEARQVEHALAIGDLVLARTQVSRIVGRDTEQLDASGISRAVIETLAESLCDGIATPLFALALGGARAAILCKAISTLDSMIGHHEAPYTYFGTVAARMDDLMHWIPARLTALVLALLAPCVGGETSKAFRALSTDASKHASPNAGYPESAMAGALDVCLGGARSYNGVHHETPFLHETGRRPQLTHVRKALRLTFLASLVLAALAATADRIRNNARGAN
jgi:adenosylcobinamide-phosphate synthase